MTDVTRSAAVSGTFPVTFTRAPVEPPVLTIYSDTAQTVIAVAAAPLTATADPLVWTASYPATLPAGRYPLHVAARYTLGQPLVVDTDDVLVLTDPVVEIVEIVKEPAPLASVEALEVRLGRTLAADERARAAAALTDASALVRDAVDRTYLDVNGTLLPVPGTIRSVALAVARRAFDNPNGYVSENLGSYSYSRDADTTRGGVYLTSEEKRSVRRAAGRLGIGTIDVRRNTREGFDDVAVLDSRGHVSSDLFPFPTSTYEV